MRENKFKGMKKILILLFGILLVGLMITGVLVNAATNCPTCPPDRTFNSKDGVYTDKKDLYKNMAKCIEANPSNTEICKPATAQDLLSKKEKAVQKDIQDSMTIDQAKGFNKLKAEKDLDVKLEGNDLSHGVWKDANTFSYGKNEFTKELLEDNNIKKLELKGNRITSTNGKGATFTWDNNFQLQNPKSNPMVNTPQASPSVGGLGFPGGQGSLSSLGSIGKEGLDQQFTRALGVVQQLLGLVQQIAGPLKQQRSNGKGETSIASNSNGGFSSTFDNGAIGSFESSNSNPKLLVGQNNPKNPAKVETEKGNEVALTNANIIVPQQAAAKTIDKTTIVLNGIPGNDPNNQVQTYQGEQTSFRGIPYSPTYVNFLPLIKTTFSNIPQSKTSATAFSHNQINENKITGKAISDIGGQSIELSEHNLKIRGHDITTYALKTFNELKVGGQNLIFYSGDFKTKFNNQQILISRTFPEIPYGIKEIDNLLDPKNKFRLQHYENRLGELTDYEEIVSVGDISINHPTNNRLIISEIRKDMWPKA